MLEELKSILFKVIKTNDISLNTFITKFKELSIPFELPKNVKETMVMSQISLNMLLRCIKDYFVTEFNIKKQELNFHNESTGNQLLVLLAFATIAKDEKVLAILDSSEQLMLTDQFNIVFFNKDDGYEAILNENSYLKNLLKEKDEKISALEVQLDSLVKQIDFLESIELEENKNEGLISVEEVSNLEDEIFKVKNRLEIEIDIVKNAWYLMLEDKLKIRDL